MNEAICIISGALIILFTITDIFWTTLWIDGKAGPLTHWLTVANWKIHKNTIGRLGPKGLSLAGAWLLFAIVIFWLFLILCGWIFVFFGFERSVIETQTGATAGITDKIYFVSYSLFTLGNGDFKPAPGIWQLLTPCITASGMLTVTLSITYIFWVINAAIIKRNVATQIISIGETTEDFVINLWEGKHFRAIDIQLNTISSELSMLHEQHKTYPILHYFHTSSHKSSTPYALAVLEDALSVFEFGITEEEKPAPSVVRNLRMTIKEYLETLKDTRMVRKKEEPPVVSLEAFRKLNIQTVDDEVFLEKLRSEKERRMLLFDLVRNDGWRWYSERSVIN